MKNTMLRGWLAVTLLLAVSCSSTQITGTRRRGFDQIRYASFLVHCDATDDDVRASVEEALAARLDRAGYRSRPSLELLDQPRAYTESEVLQAMRADDLDAVVRVRVENWATDVVTHPPGLGVFGFGYGRGGRHGFGHSYVEFATPAWEEERSRLRLRLELLDRETGKISWSGRARLSRSGFRDLYDLMDTVGDDLVAYLRREQLTPTTR
ncbi:MAG: hypothetical protein KDB53_05265 [Planctomycetes bacterium]|nr:hypothetical protein [Planctomycetota bacterium]